MILWGIFMDPLFTFRFIFLTCLYFIRTRLFSSESPKGQWKQLFRIIRHETQLFQDNEDAAKDLLSARSDLKVLVFGHTHKPMNRIYASGKQYINTGSWTKMINLDFRNFGQTYARTYAVIRQNKQDPSDIFAELRQWHGETRLHSEFQP